LIDKETVENGIVFCNRKRDVDIVAKSLNVHGHDAAPIHGDLAQSLRTQTLERFRNGEIKYLVASDVAARGLDVPSVSHVFNYDVPNHSEDYVHRIGRTGRAGREGDAIMLVARLDERNYEDILDLIKVESIEEYDIPGIEDFPKDGGKYRRGGRDSKRRDGRKSRGGRDKGRGKNHRRDDNSADDTEPIAVEQDTPKVKKAEPRKPAPKRKNDDKTTEDTQLASTDKKHSESKKNRSSEDSKETSERKRSKASTQRSDRQDRSKTRHSSRDHKGKKKPKPRYRDGIGPADHAGFGDDVPAFFKTNLKDKK